MNFRQLESFVTLASELHFGRAAALLHLSQPALSQQIRKLERELNKQLLVRSSRKVSLTSEGARFYPLARQALAHYQKAEALIAPEGDEFSAVHVGYVGSALMSETLLEQLRLFEQNHQGVLRLQEANVQTQLSMLETSELDCAIIRGPIPLSSRFCKMVIAKQPLICALPQALAQGLSEPLSLCDLSELPFILIEDPPGTGLTGAIIAACDKAGFVPRYQQSVVSVNAALAMVAIGLGAAIIPQCMVSQNFAKVRYFQLKDELAPSELLFLYRRNNHHPGLIELASQLGVL